MKDHIILLCVLFAFLTQSTAFATEDEKCEGKLIKICKTSGTFVELLQEVRKNHGPKSGQKMCGQYCANQNQVDPPRQCDATQDKLGISEVPHESKNCLYYVCACHWVGAEKEPSPL